MLSAAHLRANLLVELGEMTGQTQALRLVLIAPTARRNSRYSSCDWWRADGAPDLSLAEIAQGDEAPPFDAIPFNSALHLFYDPLRPVERYVRALNEHRVLMLSIDTGFRGETAILQDLKPTYPMQDQTGVIRGAPPLSWVCTVLPSAREADRRDDRL